ncbi:MAG: rhodanese-like domain-containing protein [Deltaproteobacteria bacterium]
MNASRRVIFLLMALVFSVALVSAALADAPEPAAKKKQTVLKKYVTAAQAYEKWKANPKEVAILDVRTPEEYDFVGHPTMATNVPFELWTGKWNPAKKKFVLKKNPEFVTQVKKKWKPNATLLIMCRSGSRSAAAVNALAKDGFKNAYTVVDGFEGDKVKDKSSAFHGQRMVNGWRNAGAPWSYKLDPNLVYKP